MGAVFSCTGVRRRGNSVLRITDDSVHGTRRCRHKITNSTQVGPDQLYVSGLDSRYTWLSHLDIYEFRNETPTPVISTASQDSVPSHRSDTDRWPSPYERFEAE